MISKYIKYFISLFTKITTWITFAVSITFAVNHVTDWSGLPYITYEILAAAALTSLVTIICLPYDIYEREMSSFEYNLRFIIHYLLINVSIMTLGYFFDWFTLNVLGIVLMAVMILFVYVFTRISMYRIDKNSADEINDALEKYSEK